MDQNSVVWGLPKNLVNPSRSFIETLYDVLIRCVEKLENLVSELIFETGAEIRCGCQNMSDTVRLQRFQIVGATH